MLTTLGSCLIVIVTIHMIILVHEWGHYLVARWLRIRVQTFTVGLGKCLYQYQDKHQVTWRVGLFPLGGYVTLLDSRAAEYTEADYHAALDNRSCWQKIGVYLAGPLMNMLVATLLYTALYIHGVEYIKPLIGKIVPQSIAANAGMKTHQTITHVGGVPVGNWHDTTFELIRHMGESEPLFITTAPTHTYKLNIQSWEIDPLHLQPLLSIGIDPYVPFTPATVTAVTAHSPASGIVQPQDTILQINERIVEDRASWIDALHGLHNRQVTLSLLRHNQLHQVQISTSWELTREWQLTAYTGIVIRLTPWPEDQITLVQYPPQQAWYKALEHSLQLYNYNWILLKKVIQRIIPITALSGPIGFVKVAINTLNHPLTVYLELVALFNILISFVNLLPLPGLDGGHIAFTLVEAIRGRALSDEWQYLITRFSIIFLVVITIHATINDLIRIVT
jgi:regulator of sigma E protease